MTFQGSRTGGIRGLAQPKWGFNESNQRSAGRGERGKSGERRSYHYADGGASARDKIKPQLVD